MKVASPEESIHDSFFLNMKQQLFKKDELLVVLKTVFPKICIYKNSGVKSPISVLLFE